MRIALIGQQEFGKAVFNAFLKRGDEVAGVFCAPETPGSRPDPLAAAAQEAGIGLFRFASYSTNEAQNALRGLNADIGIMAYVLIFAPQAFVKIPKFGTIQFHPSLLPAHRGPSSINWPIIMGRTKTGLSIFRPTDGLDEGPLILQREVGIGPDDTLGTVYFDKLFPLGVEALLEAADLVVSGRAMETPQNEAHASYEGWVLDRESHIDWAKPAGQIYNLIRGCNPQPGAWTTVRGERLAIFDCRKRIVRTFGEVRGRKLGEVVECGSSSFTVLAAGGFIEVLRCKRGEGKKVAANEAGIEAGTMLGT
ncbi:MAG TPA: methionyl-tRNA formyltransferase [Hyphomicrobiales bacterium]|nr:methionyl-tRNA formyltransferase [Hyphomicrobiales bacterium]